MTEPQNFESPAGDHSKQQIIARLPFELVVVGTAQMAHVSAALSRWAEETAFTKESYVEVATAYARYCSAPSPSIRGLTLASEYLAWFLCLNDIPADDYKRTALLDVRGVVQGEHPSARTESKATHAFFQRLEQHLGASSLERFRQRTRAMIDAFVWEVDWLKQTPGQVPSTEQYLAQRQHLIAHYPYIELWRLTEGVEVVDDELWAALRRVEIANTRVIFWVNDILSTFRDARKGKINLVTCIASDEKCTHDVALGLAKQQLDRCVADYTRARDSLCRIGAANPDISRHVRFLDSVLEGNRIATVELYDRFWGSG